MASLYLGTGQLEQELVRSFAFSKRLRFTTAESETRCSFGQVRTTASEHRHAPDDSSRDARKCESESSSEGNRTVVCSA